MAGVIIEVLIRLVDRPIADVDWGDAGDLIVHMLKLHLTTSSFPYPKVKAVAVAEDRMALVLSEDGHAARDALVQAGAAVEQADGILLFRQGVRRHEAADMAQAVESMSSRLDVLHPRQDRGDGHLPFSSRIAEHLVKRTIILTVDRIIAQYDGIISQMKLAIARAALAADTRLADEIKQAGHRLDMLRFIRIRIIYSQH